MESGRLSREVEFEFGEDGAVAATGQVRGVILRHLHHGEVDSAVKLLAKCPPEMGDAILTEDAAAASLAVKQAVAEMFVKAKDYDRAARAAVLMGDPGKAAPFFEQAGQLAKAAELYEKGGKLEQAGELYLRDLKFEQAARLFDAAGRVDRAAETLEKAGWSFEAGQLWMKARRLDKAVEVLQKVDPRHDTYVRSAVLLGRILESAGHRDAAAQKYLEIVKTRAIDAHSVEAFERLAEIYVAMRQNHFAHKLLTAVVQFDPSRERAARTLTALNASGGASDRSSSTTLPSAAGGPVSAPGGAPSGFVALASGTLGSSPRQGSSPDLGPPARAPGGPAPLVLPPMPGQSAAQPMPASMGGPSTQPMSPPGAGPASMPNPAGAPAHGPAQAPPPSMGMRAAPPQAGPQPHSTAQPSMPQPHSVHQHSMQQPPSMHQVQAAPPPAPPAPLSPEALALRELPAFAELTPDELRGLSEVGERCTFAAGEVVIEQEQEAKFVFVILSGVMRVARVAPDGMFPLAELGQGSIVGELALVDEGPTSARVKAHTEVVCLRWSIPRLRQHLGGQERAMLKILKVVTRTLSMRLRETNRRLTS